MGHIRGHGCRDLLIYCGSGRCNHSATGDWLADDVPVRSLCRRMVCTQCGMIGADVRPDWSPQVKGAADSSGAQCPQLAGADISPKASNSRFDPISGSRVGQNAVMHKRAFQRCGRV
jgi:hypothetical protein